MSRKMTSTCFGSRRGNDRIMTRGTFGNVRIKNQMVPGTEGGITTLDGETVSIHEAAHGPPRQRHSAHCVGRY